MGPSIRHRCHSNWTEPPFALALTAPITHSRIRMLNDPDTNGGNAFLAASADGSSGLMMVEYVAAGAIAEIRSSAQPAIRWNPGAIEGFGGGRHVRLPGRSSARALGRRVPGVAVLRTGGRRQAAAAAQARRPALGRARRGNSRWPPTCPAATKTATSAADIGAADLLLDDLGRLVDGHVRPAGR